MKTLAELQRNFMSDCLSKNLKTTKPLLTEDIDTGRISASGLMGIYQNSAIANIIQAMKLTYPVIEKLVGEDFFRASCKKFISTHCPKSANMDDYGAEFSDFLAHFEHAKPLAYLKDVAQLEWLFHLSSLAADSKVTDWSCLSSIPADESLHVKLLLSPSVKLMSSSFPIDNIWRMNQPNGLDSKPINLILEDDQQTQLVVFRRGLKTQIMTISIGEYALLLSFSKQQSLINAIEVATNADKTLQVDDTIQKFIGLTIISGFKSA